jgi:hypothetical protein
MSMARWAPSLSRAGPGGPGGFRRARSHSAAGGWHCSTWTPADAAFRLLGLCMSVPGEGSRQWQFNAHAGQSSSQRSGPLSKSPST